jgi:hypothetical protein
MKKYIILFPEDKSYKIYYFTTNHTLKYILQTKNCYKLNLHKLFQGYENYKKYTKKLKNPKNLYLRQITGKF